PPTPHDGLLQRSLFLTLTRRPPRPPLFPYTTLFRSLALIMRIYRLLGDARHTRHVIHRRGRIPVFQEQADGGLEDGFMLSLIRRSEEHTSELQSRENLVCRLLLEKKKKNTNISRVHV